MATCPRCGGFLGECHHCIGIWRLHLRAMRSALLGGVIGGMTGSLMLLLIYRQVSWPSVIVAAAIGIIVVMAMQWGEPPATRR